MIQHNAHSHTTCILPKRTMRCIAQMTCFHVVLLQENETLPVKLVCDRTLSFLLYEGHFRNNDSCGGFQRLCFFKSFWWVTYVEPFLPELKTYRRTARIIRTIIWMSFKHTEFNKSYWRQSCKRANFIKFSCYSIERWPEASQSTEEETAEKEVTVVLLQSALYKIS